MSWKIIAGILGGVVVGVGAVAAAPFTGGGSVLGAVTLAASLSGGAGTVAAIAGSVVVGGAAGGYAGHLSEESENVATKNGINEGEKNAKAEYAIKFKELEDRLKKAVERLQKDKTFFNRIYSMAAVAVVFGHFEGKTPYPVRDLIEQLIVGLAFTNLPDTHKDRIEKLYEKPENIGTAYKLAQESNIDWPVFDDIINIVTSINPENNKDALVQKWTQLRTNNQT